MAKPKKDFKLDLTPLKDTAASPKEPDFDWLDARQHLVSVSEYYSSFAGKPGYNPFIYMNKVALPLARRFEKGERTKALFDAIMALKKEEPKV